MTSNSNLAKSHTLKKISPPSFLCNLSKGKRSCLHHTYMLQVEAKLIDKLDSLMSEGKGDETYRELFNSM